MDTRINKQPVGQITGDIPAVHTALFIKRPTIKNQIRDGLRGSPGHQSKEIIPQH
jgi:hypothetical protein